MRIRSIKPEFWSSFTMHVIAPTLVFNGPMSPGRHPYAGLAPSQLNTEYVYMLFDSSDVLLYVGRSFRPADRFTKHRRKDWWTEVDGLVLLRVDGTTPRETAAMTARLERLAIEQLNPARNIAGMKVAI